VASWIHPIVWEMVAIERNLGLLMRVADGCSGWPGEGCSIESDFMNMFRSLGCIDCNGEFEVHGSWD